MLKFVKIKDQSEKTGFLLNFKPEDSAFIVSDIKTKFFLESELLKKHFYLQGSCVMRANEFYKELFYSLDKQWNLLPDSLVKELFFDFCRDQKEDWIKNLSHSKSFFEFFNSFLIVFLHRDSLKAFEEWLKAYKKNLFWKKWFQLSQKFFESLTVRKILNESAVKSLLLYNLSSEDKLFHRSYLKLEDLGSAPEPAGAKPSNSNPLSVFNKNRILVDLSFSLDLCEKEIFTELARYKEVYILSPQLKYKRFFENKVDIYEQWEKELNKEKIMEYPAKNVKTADWGAVFKIKTETQIEEVKKAVTQARQWIQKGVSPNDIVIYAPHIENYWFALKSYFEKENIPFRKTVYSKWIDFKDIKYLLSAVRVHLNLFGFEDLELFCFYKESKKDFQSFKQSYFEEPRRDLAQKLLFQNKTRNFNQKVTGFDFVEWLLSFWPQSADPLLLDGLLSVLQKMTLSSVLTFQSWLRFLESELLSKELEILSEREEGISCLSFNAFHSVKSPYVFILGLTEEALKEDTLFSLNESEDILEDLGFPIEVNLSKQKESSLLWFLQSSHYKELYLSCHSYDFNGDSQTGSLLYMLSDKLFSAKEADLPSEGSWDRWIKQKTLPEILNNRPEEQAQALIQAFKEKSRPFFPSKKIHLSANSLKTYRDCPFKYAADKLFFAVEKPVTHREAGPLLKGKLVHKLLEKALTEYPELEMTQEQISRLIEDMSFDPKQLLHKKQYLLLKEYLKRILEEFLTKEKKQREKFPYLKPAGFEAELAGFWNQKKGELSAQGDYEFKGFLDRVDQDEKTKQYVLRDYKASAYSLTNVSSWLKNEELQLTFYAQALEKGLVEGLPAGRLSAVFYSIYGDQFKDKGFEEKECHLSGIMTAGKGHKQEKALLYKAINFSNRFTQEKVKQMEEGKFLPHPKNPKDCKKCFYQTWCRVEDK